MSDTEGQPTSADLRVGMQQMTEATNLLTEVTDEMRGFKDQARADLDAELDKIGDNVFNFKVDSDLTAAVGDVYPSIYSAIASAPQKSIVLIDMLSDGILSSPPNNDRSVKIYRDESLGDYKPKLSPNLDFGESTWAKSALLGGDFYIRDCELQTGTELNGMPFKYFSSMLGSALERKRVLLHHCDILLQHGYLMSQWSAGDSSLIMWDSDVYKDDSVLNHGGLLLISGTLAASFFAGRYELPDTVDKIEDLVTGVIADANGHALNLKTNLFYNWD